MKTSILSMCSLIFLMTIATEGYTQLRNDREFVTGKVMSINRPKGEITVSDSATKRQRTFTVEKGIPAELSEGKEVIVNAVRGTQKAKSVRLVKKY